MKTNEINTPPGFESVASLANQRLESNGWNLESKEMSQQASTNEAIPLLDESFGRGSKGKLTIIAGRPSMGKTGLVLSLALDISEVKEDGSGQKVAFFSLETGVSELFNRLVAMETEYSSNESDYGNQASEYVGSLQDSLNRLSRKEIYIDDTAASSIADMREKSIALKAGFGLDVIMIDCVQLIGDAFNEGQRREHIYKKLISDLKQLAIMLDVQIVATYSLNRSVEQRSDPKPRPSDWWESGASKYDVDELWLLYRPEYYHIWEDDKGRSTKNRAELEVITQPHGTSKTVELAYNHNTWRFGLAT